MTAGNALRIAIVVAACAAAVGSATSTSSSGQGQPMTGPGGQGGPPPSQDMEPTRALGLWRSTFGAVKIEPDGSKGGLAGGGVHGIWVYQRQGREVVGYFAGSLRGNVLEFRWQEPNDPPLTGQGYLVFDVTGRQYAGRWWSDRRDRVGDWNGWRQPGQPLSDPSPYAAPPSPDGQSAPYRGAQPYRPSADPAQQRSSQPPAQQQSPYF